MGLKQYFKRQLHREKLFLEHDTVSDFYACTFITNNSATPLLLLRTIIFVGCVGILLASMVLMAQSLPFRYWPIYLTHWGLVLNTIAAGLAFTVSLAAFVKGTNDVRSDLPWYLKAYWAMFNMATPIALFITIFYWLLLTGVEQDFAINLTLDIFIHGVNSILMLGLLFSTRHPIHLMHFYFPILIGIIYLIFSVIYYVAGGTDPFGNLAIYPMLDWSKPGQTVGISALSALGIVIIHVLAAALAEARAALTRRCVKEDTSYNIDEAYY